MLSQTAAVEKVSGTPRAVKYTGSASSGSVRTLTSRTQRLVFLLIIVCTIYSYEFTFLGPYNRSDWESSAGRRDSQSTWADCTRAPY